MMSLFVFCLTYNCAVKITLDEQTHDKIFDFDFDNSDSQFKCRCRLKLADVERYGLWRMEKAITSTIERALTLHVASTDRINIEIKIPGRN